MATLKLKKPAVKGTGRAPVRGGGKPGPRPTLAQAQAERAERAGRTPRAERAAPGDGARRSDPRRPHEARDPRDSRPPHDARGPRDERPPRDARAPRDDRAARDERPRRGEGPRGSVSPAPRRSAPVAREVAPPARRPPPPRPDAREPAAPDHPPGAIRLSKRMSELDLASRREADEWIARGWVRVDGRIVDQLGARVLPHQAITIDPRARREQALRVTVLLHKPIGYVSGQAEDGYEPAVVLVRPENRWREDRDPQRFHAGQLRSLVPAGRLDIDSTGLLVLTQDGRIAKQLIGEDSEVEKEYLVRVRPVDAATPLGEAGLARLRHGLALDGVQLRPAHVEWVNEDQLRFVLREGRKRQIRRMCEAVGLEVTGLKRVRIGRVMLGDLPAGQWRYLGVDEAFA